MKSKMNWLKKSETETHYHGFFSVSHANHFGFHTVLSPIGKEVDVTKLIPLKASRMTWSVNLPNNAVYVGACTSTVIILSDDANRMACLADSRH